MTLEDLEKRVVELEELFARQERLMDDFNAELLRLNRENESLQRRILAHEARHDVSGLIRPLSEEVPPPHY